MYDFSALLPYGIEANVHDIHNDRLIIHASQVRPDDSEGKFWNAHEIVSLVRREVPWLNGSERIKGIPIAPYQVTSEGHRLRIQRTKGKLEVFYLYPGRGVFEIEFHRHGYYHLVGEGNLHPSKIESARRHVKSRIIREQRWQELPR